MPAPVRVGSTVIRHSLTSGPQFKTIDIPAGTQPGDTMIFFAEWGGGLPSGVTGGTGWPSSWTNIEHENHGTRGYTVWHAGTYTSGSTLAVTFDSLGTAGVTFSLAVIRGAAPFANWTIGPWWDRNGLGGGIMNTTTRALGISAPSESLVLSFHGEATNATETGASSISGATKWFESDPQTVSGVSIERVYVSYREVVSAETTPNVDVTWPNTAQNGAAIQVAIPGDSAGPQPDYPVVKGTASVRHANDVTPAVFDITTIPTDSWMVVSVMASAASQNVTAPTGWTSLALRETTGTRRNFIFGKIKTIADGSSASFTQVSPTSTTYALIWGSNAASIDTWQVGPTTVRSIIGEPSGARYTSRAASITTNFNNSLVLAVSHEATLALNNSYEISSFTSGWSQNYYLPQVAVNDRIETIWYGSKVMEIAGVTGNADVIYITPQDYNAWGIQIEIPNPVDSVETNIPYVVASSEVFSGSTGTGLTFNKPVELQDGDMILAILRCQPSSAYPDWAPVGTTWSQIGPVWPGSSGTRLNALFTRVVASAASEPSTYVFSKTNNDSNRRMGQLIILRSDGGTPEFNAAYETYGGVFPAAPYDKGVGAYSVTTPSLEIFWAATEFASPHDHAIVTYPNGVTTIREGVTSTNTAISRTAVYSGWTINSLGSTTAPLGIDWLGSPSGPAAGSVSFITGSMPDQTGTGLTTYNGQGQNVKTYYTTAHGLRSPREVLPIRRGFSSVAEMLATPGFTWAHRGGSISWPEMSLHAYTQAVARGYGVLEVSLGRTSDGVWFGLHDQTTDRTSGGTFGTPASQTWAQIQAQQNTHGPGGPQPYMRWEEIVAIYGNTHIIVADPKYALGTYRVEFLNMVNADLGPTKAIIKYSGGGSGAANLSTQAQLLGFQTWGFFYAGDASVGLGGNGALQTWGPSWTLLGMEYGASQAIWDEVLALGKPIIGHIAPNQAAYNTAMAKGASGVQVSGVAAVRPVSWWTKPYPKIVGVTTSSRIGSGTLTVTLPKESGGCYMILLVGDDAPTQPTTPSGWTLVNWSTGNTALNMGIYTAPAGVSAPMFTLTQPHNGGFVATAMRFNTDTIDITGSGGNNTMTSTSMTATKPGYMIWSLSGSLGGVPPATFTYPTGVPDWQTSAVSAGTEGGVALGIACVAVPVAGPVNSVTWGLDNQSTVRAGGFFITYPS